MYDVTWTDAVTGRTSLTTEMVVINPDTGLPWVNNEIFVSSDPTATFASVARDADGDFVVTWSVYDTTTSWDVYARRYDAAGNALDDAFLVNSETVSAQQYSTVAMDNDGDFVVTWQSLDQDGSGWGVYAQRYDTVGIQIGGTDEVQMLEFVGNPTGTFALCWNHDQSSLTPDLVTADITYDGNSADAAEQIEIALNDIGAEVEVDAISTTSISIRFVGAAGSKNQAPIALDPASTNLIGDPGATVIVSTRVDGSPGEFRVNDTVENHQMFPSIAMSSDGMFVVSWTSYGQDGDASYESNVYVKQFPSNDVVWDYDSAMTATAYNTINPLEGLHYQTYIVTADDPANHVVYPGTGRDGVVLVDVGMGMGSGTLLLGGRYVLTASHVVWDDFSRAPWPASEVSVVFDTTAGHIEIQASEIFVAPDFNGNPFVGGDVAVIMLSENAPDGVEAYDIYRGAGEMNAITEKLGYGMTGTGNTGAVNYDGLKRTGVNRYEALGSILGLTDKLLVYDFDNGLAENDAFGVLFDIHDLGEGNDEVNSAQGDSGGPSFLNGMIAGVCTGGGSIPGDHDIVPGDNSSFGEFGMDTRVSDYADWIDSVTRARSGEILVNESFISNDQKWSSVAMDSDGDFVVTWTSYGQDGVGNGYGDGVNGQEGVFARRFDSSADPTSGEFNVNTFGDLQQQHSRVAMDADGDFVITWESFQDRQPGGSDAPDSFGIYAQQYVRSNLIGTSPFIGTNGELGSELAVNSTTDGDQRYPGIAMDDTGDFVIVWSGNGEVPGQQDDQGIFSQRYYMPEDDAGPIVADVLNVVQGSGGGVELQRVKEGTVLPSSVTQFVLSMGENLSTEGIASGAHSVLNLENWHLTKDGAALTGGVAAVEFGLSMTSTGLANDPSEKYESVVTFDGDPLTAGVQPLERGVYVLTLKDSVEDIFGNSLDGNYDGRTRGHFQLNFSIQVGSGGPGDPGDPGYPGGPGDPGEGSEDGQVNTDWANAQNDPVVASNDDGDHVIVWVTHNNAGEGDIAAQLFDRYGRAAGGEFTINSHMAGSQIEPDVAMDRFGNFVVTWSGVGENDESEVFARVFDQGGMPMGDQFRVNEYWHSIQDAPSVAMDAGGNFVVAWTSYGQDGDKDGVFARRYNIRGESLGSEFQVNSTFTNRQDNADIAIDANGNFAVVWASDAQDGSSWGVYGQRYNNAGVKQGGEFRINTIVNDKQLDPQIAMDSNGNFVVAWSSFSDANTPSGPRTGYDIYARRYNAAGAAQNAGEFLVNQTVPHWQVTPAVSMADDGMFAITWSTFAQDNEVTEDYGIYARIYNPDGSNYFNPETGTTLGEFRVNATIAGDQIQPAVAMDADGDFVIAWTGQGNDQTEIYRRVIALNPDTYTTTGSSTGGSTTGGFIGDGGGGDPSGDTTVLVTGTGGDDTFEFIGGATSGIWTVMLNGVLQNVGNNAVAVSFNGIGGNDTVMLYGTAGSDVFELWLDHGTLVGVGYTVGVVGVESISVDGIGGDDIATMHDAATNDMFVGYYTGADWYYDGAVVPQVHVCNVANVHALATAGGDDDYAKFYDSTGNDEFVAAPWNGYGEFFYSDGRYTKAEGYDRVDAFATAGGFDKARFYDTTGDDSFWAKPTEGRMTGPGGSYTYRGKYFDQFRAFGSMGGYDKAKLFDSSGDDTFTASAYDGEGHLYGDGYHNWVKYFEEITGEASQGGHDTAKLYDSAGDDTFDSNSVESAISHKKLHRKEAHI